MDVREIMFLVSNGITVLVSEPLAGWKSWILVVLDHRLGVPLNLTQTLDRYPTRNMYKRITLCADEAVPPSLFFLFHLGDLQSVYKTIIEPVFSINLEKALDR